MDESDFSISSLMRELRIAVRDSSERRLILPKTLGDLEKPECLAEMHDKIQKLKVGKDLLDSGQITQMEYSIWKDEILSKRKCPQSTYPEIKYFHNVATKLALAP